MHGEEDPRGMGMFLIQALVDEAEWVAGADGKSSYVRLVIRLDKEADLAEVFKPNRKRRQSIKCRAKPSRALTSSLPQPDIRSPSSVSRAISPAPRKTRSWAPTRRCPRRPQAHPAGLHQGGLHQFQRHRAGHPTADRSRELRPEGVRLRPLGALHQGLTMVGITKYAGLFPTEAEALAML